MQEHSTLASRAKAPEKDSLPDKEAFTVEQWCEATGDSRSGVYEALRLGKLKAKKRGRRTIILRSDGVDYLESLPDYRPQEAA